jgi:hypothetical protein
MRGRGRAATVVDDQIDLNPRPTNHKEVIDD